MKQIATIKQKNYEKASQLLGELFDAASNITEQINCCIQRNGISVFFENLEAFDFSEDVIEKFNAVKTVLFEIDEEAAIQKSKEIKEV